MDLTHFAVTNDADGVALVTWDSPGRSMNVFSVAVMDEFEQLVEALAADAGVKAVVVASGKESFSAGADLTMLEAVLARYEQMRRDDVAAAKGWLLHESARMSRLWRRVETLGKPVVVAIGGTCLGGAFELALAAHGRVAAAGDYRVGLPEVKIGIFPGAGGTQRVMRMADAQAGLTFLLKGQTVAPEKALKLKLLDEVVPKDELLAAAKAMALRLSPVKPWDEDKFRPPGGAVFSPAGFQFWPAANAIYRRETHDNYPGARAIMAAAFEGLQLPIDLGLRVESRLFADVLTRFEAKAMLRTLFVSTQALNKGARRPAGVPVAPPRRVGIIGAGFMGAGIAHVTAAAGIEVVLVDRDEAAAAKGFAAVAASVAASVAKGRITAAGKDELLSRVAAGADYAALAGCDLVVEAVFEDRAAKAEAMAKAAAVLGEGTIVASNTSTLPISSLAAGWRAPEDFVGIHFFSPVEKMPLVEVIREAMTSDRAVAMAFDFVRAIGKTPIVVGDGRGFYANRCVTAYLREAHLMLAEGVPPAMIENLARRAGMPVGPLALNDEVALDLGWKILAAAKRDLGAAAVDPRQEALLKALVEERGRLGRKNGKGFYDYPEKGRKRLWRGIEEIVGPAQPADSIDAGEIERRLLAVQALEAARCVEEGIVADIREADVGSILGFGFAPFTGGTISYIDGMGTPAFVALCEGLAERHGPRFSPNRQLADLAARGAGYYETLGPRDAAGERGA